MTRVHPLLMSSTAESMSGYIAVPYVSSKRSEHCLEFEVSLNFLS